MIPMCPKCGSIGLDDESVIGFYLGMAESCECCDQGADEEISCVGGS